MIDRDEPFPPSDTSTPDTYSPARRTALVLTGTGTDGAYHAGVLRALQEAGVKLDIVGARGIGVVGALFAAVDGVHRLWDEKGFWRAPQAKTLYDWRPVPRLHILHDHGEWVHDPPGRRRPLGGWLVEPGRGGAGPIAGRAGNRWSRR